MTRLLFKRLQLSFILFASSLVIPVTSHALDRIDPQVNLVLGHSFAQYGYTGIKVNFLNYKIANEIALNTAGLGLGLTFDKNMNLLFSPVGLSYMNWIGVQLDASYVPVARSFDLGLSLTFNILHLINR